MNLLTFIGAYLLIGVVYSIFVVKESIEYARQYAEEEGIDDSGSVLDFAIAAVVVNILLWPLFTIRRIFW